MDVFAFPPRKLAERRASPNATVPRGQTRLVFAAMRGRAEGVKLLLDAGASATVRGPESRTPLSLATDPRTTDILRARGGRHTDALLTDTPEALPARAAALR
jgi:ankyrin repeat protein